MAMQASFSCHHQPNTHRDRVERHSRLIAADRDCAAFFDGPLFESEKRRSNCAMMRFLREELSGSSATSATCVPACNQAPGRLCVRHDVLRDFADGRGLSGIHIRGIATARKQGRSLGPIPSSLIHDHTNFPSH
jgi:hypothetical protein